MPVFDFFKDKKENKDEDSKRQLKEIEIGKIVPNPNQPRITFNDESIQELADSIKQVGLIQPLVVRKAGDHFELVAGERRLRACKGLNMTIVPCIIQSEVFEEASAMMALIENLQREDLHYLEEAQCYESLLKSFMMTQEELANRLGRSQSSIANKLRLLKLSENVKSKMVEAKLTERHARALLKLKDEKAQLDMIEKIQKKSLSVKDTEKLVEKTLDKLYDNKVDGARPRPTVIRLIKDYRLFMNTINSAVNQLREAGMTVEVDQQELDNGVDIRIKVIR